MLLPPLATPASWTASTFSGLSHAKPIVPPLACVATLPSIGLVFKHAKLGAIEVLPWIDFALWDADGAEHSIVELLMHYIVGPDHDVREHG